MADESTKPALPDYSTFPVLVDMEFEAKLIERQELKAMIVDMEEKVDNLNKDIEAAMVVANVIAVNYNGITVRRQNGRSASKISPQILAQNGVAVDVIAAATVPGTAYTYIMVNDPSTKKSKKEIAQEAANGDAS